MGPIRWIRTSLMVACLAVSLGGPSSAASTGAETPNPAALSGPLDGQWSDPSAPGPAGAPLAVYDSNRNRMIMVVDGDQQPRTWTLGLSGGSQWTPLETAGQSPPSGYSAIYDPIRDRMLVQHGTTLWQLQLSGTPQWSLLYTNGSGPGERYLAPAIYDPVGDRMVIYGGIQAGTVNGDLWALKLSNLTWTELRDENAWPPGPSPRFNASAVYDPHRGAIVIFGASSPQNVGEVWSFEFNSGYWFRMSYDPGPGPREGIMTVGDPIGDRMLVVGGTLPGSPGGTIDVWSFAFNGGGFTQLAAGSGPVQRRGHSLVYDPVNQRVVTFGGLDANKNALDDLWCLWLNATPSWSHMAPAPEPRQGHSAILDPARGHMVVHGGEKFDSPNNGSLTVPLSDTWVWSLGSGAWSPIPSSPVARARHSAVYDPDGDRMLVWGGRDDSDVWSLSLSDPPTWSLLAVAGTPPPARSAHAAIFDPERRRMIVFGGVSGSPPGIPQYRNDAWALELSGSPQWVPLSPSGTPPSPRAGAAAIYDPTQDRMLSFGGVSTSGYSNETWSLSLGGSGTWSQLPIAGAPLARAYATAIYDEGRTSLVVYGGERGSTTYDAETWVWLVNGSEPWRHLDPSGFDPPAVRGHTAIYDPAEGRMITFAGRDQVQGLLSQVMTLDWGASPLDAPNPRGSGIGLARVFPNPSRGAVSLQFAMAAPGNCALEVFDVAGKRVAKLLDGRLEAGVHRAQWNGRDARARSVSAGIYFVRLSAGRLVETRRLVMLEGAR